MAKKRSCRRTAEEERVHKKAVFLRKMTDTQLVEYVESQQPATSDISKSDVIREFISALSTVNGLGTATISKIEVFASENGYMENVR